MKEPILEYLEYSEPENKFEYLLNSEDDAGVDMKKLALDRKQTLQDWKSKTKGVTTEKVEKRTH
jgi:hypothetical protein